MTDTMTTIPKEQAGWWTCRFTGCGRPATFIRRRPVQTANGRVYSSITEWCQEHAEVAALQPHQRDEEMK